MVIPSHLRNKFRIESGDQMEYYTTFADNSWFLCIKLDAKAQAAAIKAAAEEKARLDRLANPTTEDLLKEIRDLLKK